MVKPILQLYPVIPSDSEEERERLRPLGRNRQRYQTTLLGEHDIVRACDEMGMWGVASIEHHFWSEGYEVGPNPGILDAYWASITKNIRVGQLGYVMSTHNPLRVAEEVAILDHLTQGRCFTGFARGYQSRWTNVLGQHLGTRATRSPSAAAANPQTLSVDSLGTREQIAADDDVNRRIFEEEVEIVLKAWTQDSMEHNGEFWQIPFPYETGVDDWPLAHKGVTARLGAPGEADSDGNVRRISVCPAPYTDPYPPVFLASSGSPESIEYAGRMGFRPTYFTSIQRAAEMGRLYVESARQAGREVEFGQKQNTVRWLEIGATEAEAREQLLRYDADIYKNFYSSMGRRQMSDPNDLVRSMLDSGLWVVGTVSSVRDQLLEQWRALPSEYITLIFHYAQMPKEVVIGQLQTFMREIKPALDEVSVHTPGDA